MGEGEGGGEPGQFGPSSPPSSPTRGEEFFFRPNIIMDLPLGPFVNLTWSADKSPRNTRFQVIIRKRIIFTRPFEAFPFLALFYEDEYIFVKKNDFCKVKWVVD